MKSATSQAESRTQVRALFERGLTDLGLVQTGEQIDQLSDLTLILDAWAQRINLTGHRGPLEIAQNLVLDAISLSASIPELGNASRLADLGSGAGFPGLPIAILNPELEVALVDSRLKRNHFQKAARRELGLSRVTPMLGRSDEIESVSCDVVVAQAMTRPEVALELMMQWAAPGALIALPASEAATTPDAPGGAVMLEERAYRVPISMTHRRIWLFRRESDSNPS